MVKGTRNGDPDTSRTSPGTPPPGNGDLPDLAGQLGEPAGFEGLVARLSATFTHLPADEVDGAIDSALRQIVPFLDIDRGGVAQFSDDGRRFLVTHCYTVPGFPQFLPTDLAAAWPWYTEQLRRGVLLRFRRLPDEIPPEAVSERAYCAEVGHRSHLAIPFQVGGRVLGALGFALFRGDIDWPDEVVARLRLLADVLGNALARKQARECEARLVEQLARTGHAVLGHQDGPAPAAAAACGDGHARPFPGADRRLHDPDVPAEELRSRAAALSPREREVMALVTRGLLNKQVGHALGIAEKTVKVHRGRVMRKMGAASLAELVRMADRLGLAAPSASG